MWMRENSSQIPSSGEMQKMCTTTLIIIVRYNICYRWIKFNDGDKEKIISNSGYRRQLKLSTGRKPNQKLPRNKSQKQLHLQQNNTMQPYIIMLIVFIYPRFNYHGRENNQN